MWFLKNLKKSPQLAQQNTRAPNWCNEDDAGKNFLQSTFQRSLSKHVCQNVLRQRNGAVPSSYFNFFTINPNCYSLKHNQKRTHTLSCQLWGNRSKLNEDFIPLPFLKPANQLRCWLLLLLFSGCSLSRQHSITDKCQSSVFCLPLILPGRLVVCLCRAAFLVCKAQLSSSAQWNSQMKWKSGR